MHAILLMFYILAFGSVLLCALDRYSHSRPLRLVSVILFVLLFIVKLIFPAANVIDQVLSLATYAIFALLQILIWRRFGKKNES